MAGSFFSELKYLGGANADFIEISVPTGTDVSNFQVLVYHANGTVRSTNALGTLVSTSGGQDVYVIDTATSATFNGLHANGGVALVENGTVTSFLSFDPGAPITATAGAASGMTSTEIGSTGSGQSLETTDCGLTYDLQTSPNKGIVPCFTPGCLISTPTGQVLVEDLQVGDLVLTKSSGIQAIRWVGKKKISGARLFALPQIQPILIKKGALGEGCPSQDIMVSPQHCVVVKSVYAKLHFGSYQVLVPAKSLINGSTVIQANVTQTTYIHILFDQHEIIVSDMMETESFLPNPHILGSLEAAVQDEIFEIFPELRLRTPIDHYGPSVLPRLSVAEGRLLSSTVQSPEPMVTALTREREGRKAESMGNELQFLS